MKMFNNHHDRNYMEKAHHVEHKPIYHKTRMNWDNTLTIFISSPFIKKKNGSNGEKIIGQITYFVSFEYTRDAPC